MTRKTNMFLQCMRRVATGLDQYDKEKKSHERETKEKRIKRSLEQGIL
jgi:hypothetical protein